MELTKKQVSENSHIFGKSRESVIMEIAEGGMNHITFLLSNLYQNPIEATVRELMSNAIDSTKLIPEALRQPIKVYLPTELDSSFIVEDFGVGMSKEDLFSVYSQYGASTKGTDLNQIGAFGLGAKAPLSYASKFTVESTKNGITTEVFISSNEEHNSCELVAQKKTDKPNGTIVTVPVQERDFESFEEAFSYYPTYLVDIELIVNNKKNDEYEHELLGVINASKNDDPDFELPMYAVKKKEEDWSKEEFIFDEILAMKNLFNSNFVMALSGWPYVNPSNFMYEKKKSYFVSMKPGMFVFSPSRDDIIKNDRNSKLLRKIESEVRSLMLNIGENILKEQGDSIFDYVKFLTKYNFSLREQSKILSMILNKSIDLEEEAEDMPTVFQDVFARYDDYKKFYPFESESSVLSDFPLSRDKEYINFDVVNRMLVAQYPTRRVDLCVLIKTEKRATELKKEIKLLVRKFGRSAYFFLSSAENAEDELHKITNIKSVVYTEEEIKSENNSDSDLLLFDLDFPFDKLNYTEEYIQPYVAQPFNKKDFDLLNEDNLPILFLFDETSPIEYNSWNSIFSEKENQVKSYLREVLSIFTQNLSYYAMNVNDLDPLKIDELKEFFTYCVALDEVKGNRKHKEILDSLGEEFAPNFSIEIDNGTIELLGFMFREKDITPFCSLHQYFDCSINAEDYRLTSELFSHVLYGSLSQDSISSYKPTKSEEKTIEEISLCIDEFFEIKGDKPFENEFIVAMSVTLFDKIEILLAQYN